MIAMAGTGAIRAFFLEAWNGGAYTVDRVKHRGQPLRIPRTSVGIFGGMQPDRLREALAGADDGLAARFVYIWPDPPPISKLVSEPDEAMRDRRNQLVGAARGFMVSRCVLTQLAIPRLAGCGSTRALVLCSMSCARRRCSALDLPVG